MTLNCRGQLLDLSTPIVMGILNITQDSFYDGGKYTSESAMLAQISKMIDEGADIIDIGAMSSKPGSELIPVEDEIKKLNSALDLITEHFPDILVSIDTIRSQTIKALLDYPIHIVNDISGGNYDPNIIPVCISESMPYVMMHMQGMPIDMQDNPVYDNVSLELLIDLRNRVTEARNQGLNDIIVDLGFGFGKTINHNFELLNNLSSFKMLECPILVGISRKSMIYKLLDIGPDTALNGTTALHMVALQKGAKILRVHDVKEAKEVIKLYQKLEDTV